MDVEVILMGCDVSLPVWTFPNWVPQGRMEDWHLTLRDPPASRGMVGGRTTGASDSEWQVQLRHISPGDALMRQLLT